MIPPHSSQTHSWSGLSGLGEPDHSLFAVLQVCVWPYIFDPPSRFGNGRLVPGGRLSGPPLTACGVGENTHAGNWCLHLNKTNPAVPPPIPFGYSPIDAKSSAPARSRSRIIARARFANSSCLASSSLAE